VSRDLDESQQERKATAGDAENRSGADDRIGVPYTLKIRSGCMGGGKGALIQTDKSATLSTLQDQTLFQPVVYDARGNGDGKTVCTITGDHCNRVTDYTPVLAIDQGGGKSQANVQEDLSPTLTCTHGGEPAVCYDAKAVDCRNGTESDINGSLQSNSAHSLNGNNVCRVSYIVRRLTPMECERLQGYPDGWTDIGEWTDSNGKKRQTSDAARYKALGNSIALPPWKWVLKRLCACYERDATMASLFDGIGGFPYLWEQLNGKGTCLWASEIEEYPIAVTKMRIGG
jgi:DNA (cytosine-5)-methyltransferase 1